jgi:nucleotide-binding universal stress UspA family protein
MARVLIATDGSDCAVHAATTAMALLGPVDRATVLSVVDVRAEMGVAGTGLLGAEPLAPMTDPAAAAELNDAMVEEAGKATAATAAAVARPGLEVETRVAHGDPAAEICRVAEEDGFDVIVVGSHGSGFVKRVLVGSVSHHVVHHATVPVLVVREAGGQSG